MNGVTHYTQYKAHIVTRKQHLYGLIVSSHRLPTYYKEIKKVLSHWKDLVDLASQPVAKLASSIMSQLQAACASLK